MACGRVYKLESYMRRRTDNSDNCIAALGQKWPHKQSQSIPGRAYPQTPPTMLTHAHESFAPQSQMSSTAIDYASKERKIRFQMKVHDI